MGPKVNFWPIVHVNLSPASPLTDFDWMVRRSWSKMEDKGMKYFMQVTYLCRLGVESQDSQAKAERRPDKETMNLLLHSG